MARGKNPGDDFDRQFGQSYNRAQGKAARGESHWSDDKVIRDAGQIRPSGQSDESCGKATVILLSLLGGAAWGVSEVVSRLA